MPGQRSGFFFPSSTAQDSRVLLRGAGKREGGEGPGGAGEGEEVGREWRSEEGGERRGEGRGGAKKQKWRVRFCPEYSGGNASGAGRGHGSLEGVCLF